MVAETRRSWSGIRDTDELAAPTSLNLFAFGVKGSVPLYSWFPTSRVLAALLCLSAIYLWQFAYDGWIPHDDWMLAQSRSA